MPKHCTETLRAVETTTSKRKHHHIVGDLVGHAPTGDVRGSSDRFPRAPHAVGVIETGYSDDDSFETGGRKAHSIIARPVQRNMRVVKYGFT